MRSTRNYVIRLEQLFRLKVRPLGATRKWGENMNYDIIYSVILNSNAMQKLKALADNKPRLYNATMAWVIGAAKDKYINLTSGEVYRMTVYICDYIRRG